MFVTCGFVHAGRRSDRDQSQEDNLFSPATKKRRTRTDDRD